MFKLFGNKPPNEEGQNVGENLQNYNSPQNSQNLSSDRDSINQRRSLINLSLNNDEGSQSYLGADPTSRGGLLHVFGRGAGSDAEMERKVSTSAQRLGEGVQSIVLAAKMGRQERQNPNSSNAPVEWRIQLLILLGGSDSEVETGNYSSDIDILLENASCTRFVLRCVEHEVPPNLIHCLRLLRVLELQHAHAAAAVNQRTNNRASLTLKPMSKVATAKVSELLCLLCTDPVVGRQLKPHLFGLLALSGASYPPSGVHVASAASNVIVAFSESCLSRSLVWFLHERKMISHMTDDVKELCGMTEIAQPASSTLCLYGPAAEDVGLWLVALKTVVHLVVHSCNYHCVELVKDFDTAGGYHVLCYGIVNSGPDHIKKLMDLVIQLACCTTEVADFDDNMSTSTDARTQHPEYEEEIDINEPNLVTNPNAIAIIADLMVRSVPFLINYAEQNNNAIPSFHADGLNELVESSLEMVLQSESLNSQEEDKTDFDMARELLVCTLQLYSDHAGNYTVIESEYQILSRYLLSFPTFKDVHTKLLVLRLLEYVCTGLPGSDFSIPLRVATAMFFCYCKVLLNCSSPDGRVEAESNTAKKLTDDIMMLCQTFEKLLQFDISISNYIVHDGFFNIRISEMLSVVKSLPSSTQFSIVHKTGEKFILPAKETHADESYIAFCRILKLFSPSAMYRIVSYYDTLDGSLHDDSRQTVYVDDMITLLGTSVLTLGSTASDAALAVFEAKMVSCIDDFLKYDMMKMLELLDNFSIITGAFLGVDLSTSKNTKKRTRGVSVGNISETKEKKGIVQEECINRLTKILQVLKVVLESNESAQDLFRTCNGFEYLIKLLYCMKGSVYNETELTKDTQSGIKREMENEQLEVDIDLKVAKIIKLLVKSSFDVLGAATTPCKKNQRNSGEVYTATKSIDILSENDRPQSPSAVNRDYIRNKAFYVSFASVISGTGLLQSYIHAGEITNCAFKLVDPQLTIPTNTNDDQEYRIAIEDTSPKPAVTKPLSVQNADASRLVLALAICLPHSERGKSLGRSILDVLLKLCANENAGTSLAQLAMSGICISLTNSIEFSTMLEDPHHYLYSRFVLLLRRIASFNMSYVDFVSLLRCVAGPVLLTEADDGDIDNLNSPVFRAKRIRLPVITASVSKYQKILNDSNKTESWHAREASLCNRLTLLSDIAERGDRVARCLMGGDNLNTIALYMQKVKVHQRLYSLAEQGKMNFLEVESVDSAASIAVSSSNNATGGTNASASAAVEKVWAPLTSTGFSFSIWLRLPPGGYDTPGNIFILDLSSTLGDDSGGSRRNEFISVWYDILSQRFNVLSSVSNKPTSFPVVPLVSRVWHHILLTFQAPKRTMLSRKSVLSLCVDGRPLEADIKTDVVQLPPTARMLIGAPNPELACSGIIRGPLPVWELASTLLLSTILTPRDATSMYAAGPDFTGLFWGDRPQRLSLAATATATFAMLAESGEQGSVAGALRRRGVPEVETAGHVMRDSKTRTDKTIGAESDSLLGGGLLCQVPPEFVICAFNASASTSSVRDGSSRSNKRHYSRRLVNVARINLNGSVSTDGFVYGYGSIVSPHCFANNIQWVGGPNVLMPIVNAARSPTTMTLALRLIRESVNRHSPNLEMLQAGGGYRILGLLLKQKIIDSSVLDQCFAFAVHGFIPESMQKGREKNNTIDEDLTWNYSDRWVFTDLDAMKYLLLNHQVWDLRGSGPHLPLRLLSFLNGLVSAHSTHAAFNSRRLHLLGIIRWTLHLMLEASEFYTMGADAALSGNFSGIFDDDFRNSVDVPATSLAAYKSGWYVNPPLVAATALGGDPGNQLLLGCKTLLRRVLTYMLTPGDLEAIANAAIYTVSIEKPRPRNFPGEGLKQNPFDQTDYENNKKLMPGPVARVYLVRLLEELVVDGVNEIVTTKNDNNKDAGSFSEKMFQPHSGGGRNQNQMAMMANRRSNVKGYNPVDFAGHKQAQAFLSAFAGILTPVWFACILEGCREEASASAVFRLMILMLQSSPSFAKAFEDSGGFAPLVLSIPKFSTCPSIITSMLSQLMHAPILHLPSFSSLNPTQLCEFFDVESDSTELTLDENMLGGINSSSDPSCGIFALLAECLGRNIQLAACDNDSGSKAKTTNDAILHLLNHRHTFSSAFQSFCRTPDFLEPLAQALCLVHDEKLMGRDEDHLSQDDDSVLENIEGKANNSLNIPDSDGDQFVAWPNSKQEEDLNDFHQKDLKTTKIRQRRGSLSTVNTEQTATQRFVIKIQSDAGRCGIGMIQLLRLVLSNAVLSGPLAAPLVAALFRSFPIHASPKQVQAFHLVLIEHCKTVVEDSLQRGTQLALSNCVGVSSVLLDRLMAGFFTSEPVLETVKIILSTLSCLSTTGTFASRTLGTTEQSMLVADASHLARLTCLAALTRSRPMGPFDEGDDDLKLAVLDLIRGNLRQLLLVPHLGNSSSSRRGTGNGYMSPPAVGTRLHHLWKSASLTRCIPSSERCTYPDSTTVEEPDRAFIVALMADVHVMLSDKRNDIRVQAVATIISLLQQRKGIMSELLIADITRPDGRVETIDLINRGGFSSLYVQLEATPLAENPTTDFIRKRNNRGSTVTSGVHMYDQFFDWLNRNNSQVSAVFQNIHVQASRLFASMDSGASTPEEAIENEQKTMLLKLTLQDSSDRTILGGLERAELAQRSHDRTAESHSLWKRQGFDDLSSGALQWKFLLRQLKGSCSIWEGGSNNLYVPPFSVASILNNFEKENSKDDGEHVITLPEKERARELSMRKFDEVVTRRKLDLTEGYERQRRRMLPNYEFHDLYNVDEGIDDGDNHNEGNNSTGDMGENDSSSHGQAMEEESSSKLSMPRRGSMLELSTEAMEATAQLLKDMQLGTTQMNDDDDFDAEDREYNEEIGEDNEFNISLGQDMGRDFDQLNEDTSTAGEENISAQKSTIDPESNTQTHDDDKSFVEEVNYNALASCNDLITGLLQPGESYEKLYNVKRCTGLEVRPALLLWCHKAIYVIDDFEHELSDCEEFKINRLEKTTSTYYINLRPKEFNDDISEENGDASITLNRNNEEKTSPEKQKKEQTGQSQFDSNINYQHRCQRLAFRDVYSVYRRRYQLQQNALEFYDIHQNGILVAFSNNSDREEVLTKVLSSPLPSSIFSSNVLGSGTSINYQKFMNGLRMKITNKWLQGKITNFDFIMQLNNFAGRSYNDITQYPVFPWIIADYESEELDLNDPNTFRDLSKPMGAQSEPRAQQFRERFEALEGNHMNGDEPPPFHYGTHYSCAAYVLYYLMRLEPFSRLALSLQGGRFDVADRLFHNIGSSWKSASSENLQDVRELIPEFFYLPQFLVNSNMFDFGTTQLGKTVHHVTLPKWAKGDPNRFVRMNRMALESEYVSRNLHKWVDLIFGYKQRGREAANALNTFVHVTYEGNVDLDRITDPIQRDSIIAQIQNFGQTPSRLVRKPFPARNVMVALKGDYIDFSSLTYLSHLTPPFCIVGAPHRTYLKCVTWENCKVGMTGQPDSAVGDMCLVKGQLLGVGRTCALITPSKKYYRYGGSNNGVSVHVAATVGTKVNRVLTIHDGLHRAPITCLKPSLNGMWVVTGCTDSTVRVWKYEDDNLKLHASLCGHEGGKITCIDVSTTFGSIVTGGVDGNVLLWDLRTLTFLRKLIHTEKYSDREGFKTNQSVAAVSVSCNHKNGNILTLVGSSLTIFDINGNLVANELPFDRSQRQLQPCCAISTNCVEWLEDGIAAVTGHVNGEIKLWSINYEKQSLNLRHTVQNTIHSCPITCLRTVDQRQDTLLVGDVSGKMSVWKSLQLESLKPEELAPIIEEIKSGVITNDWIGAKNKNNDEEEDGVHMI